MNIRTIAGAIAEKFGVEGLEGRDGKREMEIDGAPVMIEETDGDAFIFNGLVGDAPAEGGEAFARILLESNQVMMHSRAVALARDPHSGAYVLVERVPAAAASDFESFCACLGKFADALESRRGTLKDFSPAAAQAAITRNGTTAAGQRHNRKQTRSTYEQRTLDRRTEPRPRHRPETFRSGHLRRLLRRGRGLF